MIKSVTISKQAVYPFMMVFLGLLVLVVVNGLTTSALSVFDEELLKEFDIKIRTNLRYKESITNFISAIFIVLAGGFVDKFKVKSSILIGLTFLTLGFFIYAHAATIYFVYLAHFCLGIALITAGSMPIIILVSTWFIQKRGFALGFALLGTSLGGFVFPPILSHFIAEYGWRNTFLILMILPVVLIFLILFFLKNSPRDLGLLAFGEQINEESNQSEPIIQSGLSYKNALKTSTFWIISLCGFLSFFSVVSIVSNLFLHLRGFDFDPKQASYSLSIYFGFSLLGKLLISSLSDYIDTFKVFTICALGMACGSLLFWTMNPAIIFQAVGLTALSWGGIYTLYNLMIVKNFGLKSAGKINGTISSFESLGSFIAPIATGFLYTHNHNSYKTAFLVVTIALTITTVLSFFFRRNQVAN